MQLAKVQVETGEIRVAICEDDHVQLLDTRATLSDVLHADQPARVARDLVDDVVPRLALKEVTLLAPLDRQEVWAAGVTYRRSQQARERESVGAGRFYDLVYSAPRPELFFKATANRVAHPGARVRVRKDSKWSVPEPELALVLDPAGRVAGYTLGNDVSARDIEGENLLYLPQAKIYERACALGPWITIGPDEATVRGWVLTLRIRRNGAEVFSGRTELGRLKRGFAELAGWLFRAQRFPRGVVLLSGTGIVPPDDFSLRPGDVVEIAGGELGELTNPVIAV